MNRFLRDDFYVKKFGSKEAVKYGSSELRRFIGQQMGDRLEGKNDRRLIILSAHDTLVALVLTMLKQVQNEAPPFATTLIFELWEMED